VRTMDGALFQRGWRALLIRMALFTVLWLGVAFVFATELYLSARGGPLKISWTLAAGSAFRDWCPWILLSPLAVILAGQFRFGRDTWRRSLMIHTAACIVFTIAYQGLLMLPFSESYFLSTGDITLVSQVMPPGLPDVGGKAGINSAPDAALHGSPKVTVVRNHPGSPFPPLPPSAESDAGYVTRFEGASSFVPEPDAVVTGGFRALGSARTTRFLHMAVLRTQFTVPIYLCIVCVCWVINHFQETSDRERRTLELETRLTQANLRALKMQLQPHFLFNTLNAISSMIHENPKAADDMVGSLSQFLRTTLDVSAKNEVPLRTELEFVDRYLEIQQTRFGERLRIQREMDSTVMDAMVPPLVLQPLVENAIRYGIESRESGGMVTIRAVREGDVLHLEVSDDGEGFSGGQMLGTGSGIGLSNTKARLEGLYGEKHQFKIIANHPTGACVKIEIPFKPSQSSARDKA
jgi:two-component sensor histidine kinase